MTFEIGSLRNEYPSYILKLTYCEFDCFDSGAVVLLPFPSLPAATHFRWDVVNFFIFVKPIEKLAKLSVDLTLACRRGDEARPGTIIGPPVCLADSLWSPPRRWPGTKNFCRTTQRSLERSA